MTTALAVNASAVLNPPSGDNIRIGLTDLVYRSSRYNEAAQLEVTGVAENTTDEELLDIPLTPIEARGDEEVTEEGEIVDPNEDIPVPETAILVSINGTRLFAGTVADITPDGEGLVTVTAFGGVRKLLQNSMTVSFQHELATNVFEQVFAAAGIPSAEDDPGTITGRPTYRIEIDAEDLTGDGGGPDSGTAGTGEFYVFREFTSTQCAEIMDVVARDMGWYWFATPENVITVRSDIPSNLFRPEYITEASAGKQQPPYQRVIVTGGRSELAAYTSSDTDSAPAPDEDSGDDSDEDGSDDSSTNNDDTGLSSHLLGREPVRGVAGEGKPVYSHTDQAITSEANAQRVAEGILEEFRRQQATGSITVVGNPEIQPLNAVRLPDELGGETYSIGNVEHRMNTTDGYLTEIGCEGVINAGSGEEEDPGTGENTSTGEGTEVGEGDGGEDGGPIDLDSDGQVG